ncbi:MAG: heavy-metal-associated domain-containing protein [Bacteroidales bacterium]|nr:heavy-metal-associated domain-containing protein [Bacteroidales bacterium]
MQTLKFKTNMKCEGCVKMVNASLEQLQGINNIETDLDSKDRTLVVEADDKLSEKDIINKVQQAGYTAEPKKGLMGKIFG